MVECVQSAGRILMHADAVERVVLGCSKAPVVNWMHKMRCGRHVHLVW